MAETKEQKMGRPTVFSMTNELCIWSRAGVLKPMKCINAFDCLGCALDNRVLTNFEKKKDAGQGFDPRKRQTACHDAGAQDLPDGTR